MVGLKRGGGGGQVASRNLAHASEVESGARAGEGDLGLNPG